MIARWRGRCWPGWGTGYALRNGPTPRPAAGRGPAPLITGWSVDTRTIQPGDMFFALRGPNHDGHDPVAAAFENGAIAAIVARDAAGAGRSIRVADTLA